jgi:hypothetical protein
MRHPPQGFDAPSRRSTRSPAVDRGRSGSLLRNVIGNCGCPSAAEVSGSGMVDDKDWTWVLERPCPECGFDAGALAPTEVGATTRQVADRFVAFLDADDVRSRHEPETWSVLEYGCHVRDVCRVMDGRLRLMLDQDGARFENWDQDATAIEDDYPSQDPTDVADELRAAARVVADRFDAVTDDEWSNRGLRSNGSRFTVVTLGQYMAHDLVHHVWDVEH